MVSGKIVLDDGEKIATTGGVAENSVSQAGVKHIGNVNAILPEVAKIVVARLQYDTRVGLLSSQCRRVGTRKPVTGSERTD